MVHRAIEKISIIDSILMVLGVREEADLRQQKLENTLGISTRRPNTSQKEMVYPPNNPKTTETP